MRRWILMVAILLAAPVAAHGQAAVSETPPAHAADRYYDPQAMADARRVLAGEHGGSTHSMALVNIAEFQASDAAEGYRWDAQASFGGDVQRVMLKSEGEGEGRGGVARAEVQALYSRAIGPYFNLQAGLRQDLEPRPRRTYATLGVEGLAPYWFEVEGALFLSDRGEVLARLEGYDDLRITQRLVLQPRVELNLAAQDVRQIGVAAGISDAELGLRLRYEVTRSFAPYLGVTYDQRFGDAIADRMIQGDTESDTRMVAGIRALF